MLRIKSIVVLATLVVGLGVAVLSHAASPTGTTSSAHHSTAAKSMPKVDLNTASKDELTKLPGIDEARAEKSIAARPFKSKADLKSRHLLTPDEYSKVAGRVMVKSSSTPKTSSSKESRAAAAGGGAPAPRAP